MRDATENVWVDKNLITANSAAGLDWVAWSGFVDRVF